MLFRFKLSVLLWVCWGSAQILGQNPLAKPQAPSSYVVSVYTGIENLVKLGDPLSVTNKKLPNRGEEEPVELEELKELKIEKIVSFPSLGLKIFYRRQKAVLILLQEPFKGELRTSKISLFPFQAAPDGSWESSLIKKLGKPQWVISGGKLNSKGLYYSWGDISFNAMGPNQLALYRDPALFKYREKYFGREIKINQPSNQ